MIAALLAAALVLAAPQPQHVIHGDRTAGGIRIAHSTPADVKKLFGAPSTSRVTSSRSCLQSWKGARLAVTFFTFEDKPCVRGVALIVTVTGRRGVAHRDRPPRRRPGRAAAVALSEGPPADGLRRRQRLLARDPAGLRRGRRRRLSRPARADEGRPRGRARGAQLRLRLDGRRGGVERLPAGRRPAALGQPLVRTRSRQERRVWSDPDARQVEPVGVPAGADGRVGGDEPVRVLEAGEAERLELRRRRPEQPFGVQLDRERGRARPVLRVVGRRSRASSRAGARRGRSRTCRPRRAAPRARARSRRRCASAARRGCGSRCRCSGRAPRREALER